MLYLMQSDASVIQEDEVKDCIFQTDNIDQLFLKYYTERKAYGVCVSLTHKNGWLGFYETEAKARAVLSDILDHMKQDNLMAQTIRLENV